MWRGLFICKMQKFETWLRKLGLEVNVTKTDGLPDIIEIVGRNKNDRNVVVKPAKGKKNGS